MIEEQNKDTSSGKDMESICIEESESKEESVLNETKSTDGNEETASLIVVNEESFRKVEDKSDTLIHTKDTDKLKVTIHSGDERDEHISEEVIDTTLEGEGIEQIEGIEGLEEIEGIDPLEGTQTFIDDSVQGFFSHSDPVYCVKVNHKEGTSTVCTGGGDDCAYLWDFKTGETIKKLEGHTDSVVSVAFNKTGNLVATAAMDATVKVWNANTGELITTLEGPGEAVEWIVWHDRGDILLAGDAEGTAWMWRGPKWDLMNFFPGHAGRVVCGLFTPDGKQIVTAAEDATLRLWNPKTAEVSVTVRGHPFHAEPINCMSHHPAKPIVITGGMDKKAMMVNTTSGKVVAQFLTHEDSIESVAFSSEFDLASTGSLDSTVRIWDTHVTSERAKLTGHTAGITKVVWHPKEAHLLYSSSLDHTLKLWDGRAGGDAIRTWKGPTDMVLDFDFTSDGDTIVIASEDTTALVMSRAE